MRMEPAFRRLRLDRVLDRHEEREGGASLLNYGRHRCRPRRAQGTKRPLGPKNIGGTRTECLPWMTGVIGAGKRAA